MNISQQQQQQQQYTSLTNAISIAKYLQQQRLSNIPDSVPQYTSDLPTWQHQLQQQSSCNQKQLLSLSEQIYYQGKSSITIPISKNNSNNDEQQQQQQLQQMMTMHFTYYCYGPRPIDGYTLLFGLHGGGGCPAHINDSQWDNHKYLYCKNLLPSGTMWVTPRAPTNTWNLWHESHIDILLRSLILTLIAQDWINPQKLFLSGYSAGGDGTWKVGTRLADIWTGISPCAGHPNSALLNNLKNTAITIHCGGKDDAYQRNLVNQQYLQQLKEYQHIEYHTQQMLKLLLNEKNQQQLTLLLKRQQQVQVQHYNNDNLDDNNNNNDTTKVLSPLVYYSYYYFDGEDSSNNYQDNNVINNQQQSQDIQLHSSSSQLPLFIGCYPHSGDIPEQYNHWMCLNEIKLISKMITIYQKTIRRNIIFTQCSDVLSSSFEWIRFHSDSIHHNTSIIGRMFYIVPQYQQPSSSSSSTTTTTTTTTTTNMTICDDTIVNSNNNDDGDNDEPILLIDLQTWGEKICGIDVCLNDIYLTIPHYNDNNNNNNHTNGNNSYNYSHCKRVVVQWTDHRNPMTKGQTSNTTTTTPLVETTNNFIIAPFESQQQQQQQQQHDPLSANTPTQNATINNTTPMMIHTGNDNKNNLNNNNLNNHREDKANPIGLDISHIPNIINYNNNKNGNIDNNNNKQIITTSSILQPNACSNNTICDNMNNQQQQSINDNNDADAAHKNTLLLLNNNNNNAITTNNKTYHRFEFNNITQQQIDNTLLMETAWGTLDIYRTFQYKLSCRL